jgi:hypothetical protein
MALIKPRDARALAFCAVTIALVYLAVSRFFHNELASVAATGAYGCFILTRPRMIRVYRRLTGQRVERSSYYRN